MCRDLPEEEQVQSNLVLMVVSVKQPTDFKDQYFVLPNVHFNSKKKKKSTLLSSHLKSNVNFNTIP